MTINIWITPRLHYKSQLSVFICIMRLLLRCQMACLFFLIIAFTSFHTHAAVIGVGEDSVHQTEAYLAEMSLSQQELAQSEKAGEEERKSEKKEEKVIVEKGSSEVLRESSGHVSVQGKWRSFIRALQKVFRNGRKGFVVFLPSDPDRPYVVFME